MKRYCKACFEPLKKGSLFTLFSLEALLCDRCLAGEKRLLTLSREASVKIFFVYEYAAPVKDWLYRYKMLKDYELRRLFFYPFGWLFRLFLRKKLIIPLPTTKAALADRGFNHLQALIEGLGLKTMDVFVKDEGPPQKDLSRAARLQVSKRIHLEKRTELAGRDIVLFDDVWTTGATFNSCLALIKECHPRKVLGLILLKNTQRQEDKAINNLSKKYQFAKYCYNQRRGNHNHGKEERKPT